MSLGSSFKSDSESDARLDSGRSAVSAASVASVARHGREGAYRVRVCLRRYFRDERARALVLVRARRRVRWLERRLRELFALRGTFRLTSAGHLLPSAEPLAILHPDDLVHVIPTTVQDDVNDLKECNTGVTQMKSSNIHSETYDTEIYVTNGSQHTPNPETKPAEYEESDESFLENYKKHALALLERNYSEGNLDAGENGKEDNKERADCDSNFEFPARKRRRVRNRKRTRRLSDNNGAEVVEASAGSSPAVVEASAGAAPAVVRERAAAPRAPRLVRAAR